MHFTLSEFYLLKKIIIIFLTFHNNALLCNIYHIKSHNYAEVYDCNMTKCRNVQGVGIPFQGTESH